MNLIHKSSSYYTHQPVLCKVLSLLTNGSKIAEFGCGEGSSPIMHEFSVKKDFQIFCFESHSEYYNQYNKRFGSDKYKFFHITDWVGQIANDPNINQMFSTIFIDQDPWMARVQTARQLNKNYTDFYIIHDSDWLIHNSVFGSYIDNKRDYSDRLKYWKEFGDGKPPERPPTLVASDHRKVDFEVDFSNEGGIQGQKFRLDIEGDDVSDAELAGYIVRDMRLLMVKEVRILNKQIIEEAHKRKAE